MCVVIVFSFYIKAPMCESNSMDPDKSFHFSSVTMTIIKFFPFFLTKIEELIDSWIRRNKNTAKEKKKNTHGRPSAKRGHGLHLATHLCARGGQWIENC